MCRLGGRHPESRVRNSPKGLLGHDPVRDPTAPGQAGPSPDCRGCVSSEELASRAAIGRRSASEHFIASRSTNYNRNHRATPVATITAGEALQPFRNNQLCASGPASRRSPATSRIGAGGAICPELGRCPFFSVDAASVPLPVQTGNPQGRVATNFDEQGPEIGISRPDVKVIVVPHKRSCRA